MNLFRKAPPEKTALVTVTDEQFFPGTLVLVASFLRHNPWFDGDIVLFSREKISKRDARYLAIFDQHNVRQELVSSSLVKRTDELCEFDPQYQHRRGQFYSLDIFRLTDYKKMLFLDSDLLIRGSFKPLFERPEPLLVVGDNYFYRDQLRNADDFSLYDPASGPARGELWPDTWSAGMMLFDHSLINKKAHRTMLKMISTKHFAKMSTNHSDQLILNQYYRNDFTLVNATYNWRFRTAPKIEEKDGVTLDTAIAIHYTAKKKPWDCMHVSRSSFNIGPPYLKAYRWWLEEWLEIQEKVVKLNPILWNEPGEIEIKEPPVKP